MTDWHHRITLLSRYANNASHDPICRVGAMLIRPDGSIDHQAVNQFPRGIANDSRWLDVDTKLRLVIHAEQACLHECPDRCDGWAMLVTKYPCHECAKVMIHRGIRHVICPPYRLGSKWAQSHRWASEIFKEAGVSVTTIEPEQCSSHAIGPRCTEWVREINGE